MEDKISITALQKMSPGKALRIEEVTDMGGHKQRQSRIHKEKGIRSRYQRCPRCKKIRMKWLPANWVWDDKPRKRWKRVDGQLICHICIQRLENKENNNA